ncbi:hypothetical protein CR513_06489, partial [Mucuna pruriens]
MLSTSAIQLKATPAPAQLPRHSWSRPLCKMRKGRSTCIYRRSCALFRGLGIHYQHALIKTISSLLFLSIHGGARCCIGVSLDRGNAGLRLGSQSLSEGTDWDSLHTLVNLILNAQAGGGEPSPSAMAIVSKSSRLVLPRATRPMAETSQYSASQILPKYDRHHPGPQDANRAASKHCEPIIVGRIQQPPLSNHSESEREC